MTALAEFGAWLRPCGEARIAGEPYAAARLFTADAACHEMPFEPPAAAH